MASPGSTTAWGVHEVSGDPAIALCLRGAHPPWLDGIALAVKVRWPEQSGKRPVFAPRILLF